MKEISDDPGKITEEIPDEMPLGNLERILEEPQKESLHPFIQRKMHKGIPCGILSRISGKIPRAILGESEQGSHEELLEET